MNAAEATYFVFRVRSVDATYASVLPSSASLVVDLTTQASQYDTEGRWAAVRAIREEDV